MQNVTTCFLSLYHLFDNTMIFFRDQSIPSLETVLANNDKLSCEIDILSQLIARQTTVESNLAQVQASAILQECTPPAVCHDFQTARLFLSHFGLLSFDEVNVVTVIVKFTINN